MSADPPASMRERQILRLENESLQVDILPAFGGKITSLRSVRTGAEFLLPPRKPYRNSPTSATFDEGDGGGFDECLPSVASCERLGNEAAVPDHGDLWRSAWQVDFADDRTVVLHADATSRPLRLTRRATLQGSSLILEYELANRSTSPATWLWSAHPLLYVDEGDRILLPASISELHVEYTATSLLRKGSTIAWPVAETGSGGHLHFDTVGTRDGATAFKLFAHVNQAGWAALYREKLKQAVIVRFDPAFLRYLGLWICAGGWPGDRSEAHSTVALEPTTSGTDSLKKGVEAGTAHQIGGKEHLTWTIAVQIADAATLDDLRISLDETKFVPFSDETRANS